MIEPVKQKRKYNSGRRSAQAAETRNHVIDTARVQFVDRGWQGTTIAGIARDASVSSETIYSIFRNKEFILRAVIEKAVRRDRPETPLLDQPGPTAVANASSQAEQIALFAKDISDILASVAELVAVTRAAAEADPALASLYTQLHDSRRRNLSFAVGAMMANGPLRNDINEAEATACLWRLASPELFVLMTKVEGLSTPAYTRWLEETLRTILLRPADL